MTGTSIPREKIIGNFKRTTEEKMKEARKHENWRDKRPGMSPDHLALIRQMPCCICLKMPCGEAHHIKDTPDKERGMSVRSTDQWTVPMCHEHHVHGVELAGTRNELKWFADRGIAALSLAKSLWQTTGNKVQMTGIVIGHATTGQKFKGKE